VPLRLLARAAPFVLGAIAAALWLRGRRPERLALPERTGPPPEPTASAVPAERAASAAEPAPRPRTGRFARAPERRTVDIVTVVDDLLGAPR
jgi:hypothetical protein